MLLFNVLNYETSFVYIFRAHIKILLHAKFVALLKEKKLT